MEYWLAYMHESERMELSKSEDEDSLYEELIAMVIDKSIKEDIEEAQVQLLIDTQQLKNFLDDPSQEDRHDAQSDTSSNMFGGDAMSIFTSMETLCTNDLEYEEEYKEDSEETEVSLYERQRQ
jgi:hypothetical protein